MDSPKNLRSDAKASFFREAYVIESSEVRMEKLTQEDIIRIKLALKHRSKSRTQFVRRPEHRVPIAIVEITVSTISRKEKQKIMYIIVR